jgi:luciferase family oxidoreductase group 1
VPKLPPLSILDLVPITKGQSVGEAVAGSVALAQAAERFGYQRVWYAEHHNMATIGSSATSVLIAHVAANTSTIRLGAGGVMLPNHAPLVIAEQFGTLASVHPGRIELGLGRAPGSDQVTMRALRRDPAAADTFPRDVVELQGYLGDSSPVPGVEAIPGRGTHVPLFLLGSSLFGARLAAELGLPYAFASHFAPAALHDAVAIYRRDFAPSPQLEQPLVLAAVNVVAADSTADAEQELHRVLVARVAAIFGRAGRALTDDEAEAALRSGAAAQVEQMLTYSAVGTPSQVAAYLEQFAKHADADELITAHHATSLERRLRSVQLTAEAMSAV